MDIIAVGIDVSKDRLDIAVCPSGEVFAVERNASGVDRLIDRMRTLSPSIVALEATGGFETVVAASLAAAALPVVVVNPAQIRAFAKALGQRAKTDADGLVTVLPRAGLNQLLAIVRLPVSGDARTTSLSYEYLLGFSAH